MDDLDQYYDFFPDGLDESEIEAAEEFDPVTCADNIFLEEWPVHPMVAVFISLPLEIDTDDQYRTLNERSVSITATPFPDPLDGSLRSFGLPGGVQARKILLYFFHKFYLDEYFVLPTKVQSTEFINLFGYNYKEFRYTNPVIVEFFRILASTFELSKMDHLLEAGFKRLEHITYAKKMLVFDMGNLLNKKETVIYLNPLFMFKTAFPVKLDVVLNAQKKCEFFNVYLFLVDVLPRIKKKKKKHIKWSTMNDIFFDRYDSIDNFKHFFVKKLAEVLEYYPQAKGCVDTSDKKYLICKYAPPPI